MPSDEDLIKLFPKNRPALEQLKAMAESDGPIHFLSDWMEPKDVLARRRINESRLSEYQRLLKNVKWGLSVGIRSDSHTNILVTVYAWGFSIGSSGEVGYAYLPIFPKAEQVLPSLDYKYDKEHSYKIFYRHIEGHWYLFRADK